MFIYLSLRKFQTL